MAIELPTITLPSMPISTTMISCVSNPLMIGLNVVKGALSDNLAGLASGGKDRMSYLKKTGEDIKGKLKTMVLLQLPAIPNFKTEYAILLASVNNQADFAQNALALEKRWGKAIGIAVIRGLLDNIGKIDLCKGIPNIDGRLLPDGTVMAIPKAQPSPIPAAPPAAHVPLTPTVQSATTQPTSGNSGITREQYHESLTLHSKTLNSVTGTFTVKINALDIEFNKMLKDKVFVALKKKRRVSRSASHAEYLKTHQLTIAESDIMSRLTNNINSRTSYIMVRATVTRFMIYYIDLLAGIKTQTEYDVWYKEDVIDKNLTLISDRTRDLATGKIALDTLKRLIDANKTVLIRSVIYEQNSKK